jgi:hypothetical protein
MLLIIMEGASLLHSLISASNAFCSRGSLSFGRNRLYSRSISANNNRRKLGVSLPILTVNPKQSTHSQSIKQPFRERGRGLSITSFLFYIHSKGSYCIHRTLHVCFIARAFTSSITLLLLSILFIRPRVPEPAFTGYLFFLARQGRSDEPKPLARVFVRNDERNCTPQRPFSLVKIQRVSNPLYSVPSSCCLD